MFRSDPVQTGLFTIAPIAVVAIQLLNTALNGLSVTVSVPFAIVLLAFSVLLVRYQIVQFRLTQLRNETIVQPAD